MPTLAGANGTFTVTLIPGKTPANPKKRDGISIEYKPNPGSCADIRLVQTVVWEAFDKNGKRVGTTPDNIYKWPRHRFGHRRDDHVAVGGKVYVVDHRPCEGDPFYNGDDPDDTPSKGNATNGTSTSMKDYPGADLSAPGIYEDAVETLVKTFEVCAICVDTGAVLDCVVWTSTAKRSPPDEGTVKLPTKVGTQSPGHKKALKRFVATHSRRIQDKLFWFCPDPTKEKKRGEIPKGFRKAWASTAAGNAYWRPDPDVEYAGTGRIEGEPDRILTAMFEAPEQAAIKLTWSGEQDKTRPSVLFTPLPAITDQVLGAFIPKDDGRFVNDYVSTIAVQVDRAFFLPFLGGLSALKDRLLEPGGDVTVTAMASVGGSGGVGFIGALTPTELQRLLDGFLPLRTLSDDTMHSLTYLSLNMGDPATVSADPSAPAPAPAPTTGVDASQPSSQEPQRESGDISERVATLTWALIALTALNAIAIALILMR